ncbi:branched-chain-amino-acid aminotransferase 5, chloroplastic-like isoform X1 [Olea europaea var. sylvestris]|uniref:branched-chain-amino-acid aminotransferase 5, chloroplastic-like isoform X1 n=1 Tax=Olea europaea var. sylvestris TaxID=158386 RepID=UPI000C1D613E|nr:branched-chain-amino-acid aminotransferase 5, chloroplastic-like isoform X1 [Olea europaea var. sylvestris]
MKDQKKSEIIIRVLETKILTNTSFLMHQNTGSNYLYPFCLSSSSNFIWRANKQRYWIADGSLRTVELWYQLQFVEGTVPLNLYVQDEFHRSAQARVGGVKSITNYAPVKYMLEDHNNLVLKSLNRAWNRGFSNVLYLDSMNKRYIEEASSCSVFISKV